MDAFVSRRSEDGSSLLFSTLLLSSSVEHIREAGELRSRFDVTIPLSGRSGVAGIALSLLTVVIILRDRFRLRL